MKLLCKVGKGYFKKWDDNISTIYYFFNNEHTNLSISMIKYAALVRRIIRNRNEPMQCSFIMGGKIVRLTIYPTTSYNAIRELLWQDYKFQMDQGLYPHYGGEC